MIVIVLLSVYCAFALVTDYIVFSKNAELERRINKKLGLENEPSSFSRIKDKIKNRKKGGGK